MSGDDSSMGDGIGKYLTHGVTLGIGVGLAYAVDYLIGSHRGSNNADKEGKSVTVESTGAAQMHAKPSPRAVDSLVAPQHGSPEEGKTATVESSTSAKRDAKATPPKGTVAVDTLVAPQHGSHEEGKTATVESSTSAQRDAKATAPKGTTAVDTMVAPQHGSREEGKTTTVESPTSAQMDTKAAPPQGTADREKQASDSAAAKPEQKKDANLSTLQQSNGFIPCSKLAKYCSASSITSLPPNDKVDHGDGGRNDNKAALASDKATKTLLCSTVHRVCSRLPDVDADLINCPKLRRFFCGTMPNIIDDQQKTNKIDDQQKTNKIDDQQKNNIIDDQQKNNIIDDKQKTKEAPAQRNLVPCEMIPALQTGCSGSIYMKDKCTSQYKHLVSVCNDLTSSSVTTEGASVKIDDSDLVLIPFVECLRYNFDERNLQSRWTSYGKLLKTMDG